MPSGNLTTRQSNLHVRLTASEKDALTAKAAEYGLSTSAYMRLLAQLPVSLVGSPDNKDAVIVIDAATWKRLLVESRRWGSNYNQGVRALNTIGSHYKNPPRDARRAAEVVQYAADALQYLKSAKEGIDRLLEMTKKLEERVFLKADFPDME